jgi:hypothetical protein
LFSSCQGSTPTMIGAANESIVDTSSKSQKLAVEPSDKRSKS